MFRRFLRAHIDRVTVTKIGHRPDGSLEIDADLLEAAGILSDETILCCHVSTGEQFLASVMRGPRGNRGIVLNGPLTRRGARGDSLMIFRYDYIREGTGPVKAPTRIRLDSDNRIIA